MIDWLNCNSKLGTIKCLEIFKRMTSLFNLIIHHNSLLQEVKFQVHLQCHLVHMVSLNCSQVLMFHKYLATTDISRLIIMDNHKWEDTDSHPLLMDNNLWDMVSNHMVSNQWDTVSNLWDMVSNQWDMDNQTNLISHLILQLNQVNFIACHHHNNHQSEID
jgi:hypothetical protein